MKRPPACTRSEHKCFGVAPIIVPRPTTAGEVTRSFDTRSASLPLKQRDLGQGLLCRRCRRSRITLRRRCQPIQWCFDWLQCSGSAQRSTRVTNSGGGAGAGRAEKRRRHGKWPRRASMCARAKGRLCVWPPGPRRMCQPQQSRLMPARRARAASEVWVSAAHALVLPCRKALVAARHERAV